MDAKEYLANNKITGADGVFSVSLETLSEMLEDYGDCLRKDWFKAAEAVDAETVMPSKRWQEANYQQQLQIMREHAALCVAKATVDKDKELYKLTELLKSLAEEISDLKADNQLLKDELLKKSLPDG